MVWAKGTIELATRFVVALFGSVLFVLLGSTNSMPPTPLVLDGISRTIDACKSSLKAIDEAIYDQVNENVSPSSLATIRTDFLSLLALIRAHSTTLCLAFKPPASYDAAPRPLNDLHADVSRLAGCIQILAVSQPGQTLFKRAQRGAATIVEYTESLVDSVAAPAQEDNDKLYLMRMGSLHATIDDLKNQLPLDNRTAVLESWKTNTECINDALTEYEELSKEDEAEEEDFDDFGDNWDDILGVDTSKKLSVVERERAQKVEIYQSSESLPLRLICSVIRLPPSFLHIHITKPAFLSLVLDDWPSAV